MEYALRGGSHAPPPPASKSGTLTSRSSAPPPTSGGVHTHKAVGWVDGVAQGVSVQGHCVSRVSQAHTLTRQRIRKGAPPQRSRVPASSRAAPTGSGCMMGESTGGLDVERGGRGRAAASSCLLPPQAHPLALST